MTLMIKFLLYIQQKYEKVLSPYKNYKRVSLVPATSYFGTLLCLIVGESNGKRWEAKPSS